MADYERSVSSFYRENSDEEIRDRTREALNADDLEEKIGALTVLSGVGVPVASSVLATVFPERYAVIDYRALRSLPLLSDERS
jgi:endonuclease III